jgi:four helix bundle protein
VQDFRQLKVWQKAHEIVLSVYRVTSTFPKDELYGLTSQLRRCSVSVPANIAEGCGRRGDVEFGRFLQIAFSSAGELEYHLLLARDLGLLPTQAYDPLASDVTEVKKMLGRLTARIQANVLKPKSDS